MNTEVATLSQIEEYNATAAAIAMMKEKYSGLTFDATTKEGMEVARVSRRELVTCRTSLEAKRKVLKAPALERAKLIDTEAKRLTAEIEALEAPIDAAIKAEEARIEKIKAEAAAKEKERTDAILKRILVIQSMPLHCGTASSSILLAFESLESTPTDDGSFAEYAVQAEATKKEALDTMHAQYRNKLADETAAENLRKEQEALAKEKAEHEAKKKAEMAAQQKKLDDDKAEFDRLAKIESDRLQAERDENKRIADAEQAKLQKQREEMEAKDALNRANLAAEQEKITKARAEQDEFDRLAREADQKKIDDEKALVDCIMAHIASIKELPGRLALANLDHEQLAEEIESVKGASFAQGAYAEFLPLATDTMKIAALELQELLTRRQAEAAEVDRINTENAELERLRVIEAKRQEMNAWHAVIDVCRDTAMKPAAKIAQIEGYALREINKNNPVLALAAQIVAPI